MLIAIDDHIIDTEDIYEICPVEKYTYQSEEGDSWTELLTEKKQEENIKKKRELFENIGFEIKLFNVKKPLVVELQVKHDFKYSWMDNKFDDSVDYNDYLLLLSKYECRIHNIRGEIINYWNKSKSPILQISTTD